MKTILGILTFAVFAMLLVSPFALAEDAVIAEDSTEVPVEVTEEAGTTPDSALYAFDKAGDSLRLAFTFNKIEKAQKALAIAQERLAEAESMALKNKVQAMEKAQEQHKIAIQKAENAVDSVEVDGDAEANLEAVQNTERVRAEIQTHSEKVASVKNAILERKRATMSAEQIAHLEEVFGKIMAKAQEMETKTKQKQENAKAKYKAMTGKTDAEVESDLADAKAGKKVENKVRTENAGEESEIQTETQEQTSAGEGSSNVAEPIMAGSENSEDKGKSTSLGTGEAIAVN